MNTVYKSKIVILILFTICLVRFAHAEAAWNPAGEFGEVIYEVKPQEKIIHVNYIYTLTNLDLETLYSNSYYYAWPVWVPADAINLNVGFTHLRLKQAGRYKIITIPLVKQLTYGQTESFVIQYDLKTDSPNNIEFLAVSDTYKANLQIIIPRGYFNQVWLDKTGYIKEETLNSIIYKYSINNNGRDFSVLVELSRQANILSLSNTIKLSDKNANLNIKYSEEELDKARNVQGLVNEFLPHLEKIIGVSFPQEYPILITQSTSREINRWAGINAGEKGIFMPYEGNQLHRALLHELSHYWARKPPYEEDWMHEGQAELYAYLALRDLGYYEETTRMRQDSQQIYDQYKNRFDLPLAELIIPKTTTDENSAFIDFAYRKSFLFMLKLYESLGLEYIQKANREVFTSKRTINWFEYLNILENVSGQDLKRVFNEWILSKKFNQNFDKWISLQTSYKQLYSTVLNSKGSLGIQAIEEELQLLANLISQGQFSTAENKVQDLRNIYDQWRLAIKNYSEVERIISQSKEYFGIGPVNKELNIARELIIAGQYNQALTRIEYALKLYEQWENAEKKYREASRHISQFEKSLGIDSVNAELEGARVMLLGGDYNIASSKVEAALNLFEQWQKAEKVYTEAHNIISLHEGALGMATVNKELKAAQDLLIQGQYTMVSGKVESTLNLFEQWQKAEKVYTEAHNIISLHEGALGMAEVDKELKAAQDILVQGQYTMVSGKVESTLILFEQWQKAEKTFRYASSIISPSQGILGIEVVNKELKTAQNLLIGGQYEKIAEQVQVALKLFEQLRNTNQDYRNIEKSVSKLSGLLGIDLVESELITLKDSLGKGKLEIAARGILILHKHLNKWQKTYETYLEAKRSIDVANKENRTWGLKKAKPLMLEGQLLLRTGNLNESNLKLQQVIDTANHAITPFRAIGGFAIATALFIILLVSALLIYRRGRIQRNP